MKKGTLFAFGVIGGLLLLVVAAGFLLPVLGRFGCNPSKAIAATILSNLQVALADYHHDFGVYPPDRGDGDMDKCSETLYFYLSGEGVDASKDNLRAELRSSRRDTKVYFDFKEEYLSDYDGDGYWEVIDAWGQPWIYVVTGGTRQPYHHPESYDLYSVGPDGRTGRTWNAGHKMFELPPDDPGSFYQQASDGPDDGDTTSGARYSQDDLANF